MKTLIPILTLLASIQASSAQLVMLTVNTVTGPKTNDTFVVEPYQTAELIWSYVRSGAANLTIETPSLTLGFGGSSDGLRFASQQPAGPVTVPGPATIRLTMSSQATPDVAAATFRISPSPFDPRMTAVVLPGPTNGANVQLECSTDLVSWQVATNGAYVGLPEAKFFRIRVDRLQ